MDIDVASRTGFMTDFIFYLKYIQATFFWYFSVQ